VDIELTFLGCGTSTGVPIIGCECATCQSPDPKDKRYRSSVLVKWNNTSVVVDTTPEFRLQMLRAGQSWVDAVFLTHNHADHVNGLDDLRQLTFWKDPTLRIPVYGPESTMHWVRKNYSYIWTPIQKGGGVPKIDLFPMNAPVCIGGVDIVPIPVKHGIIDIYGYRFGNIAYISDVSYIPDESFKLLEGVDVFIVDAVRYKKHATHFHLDAAIAAAEKVGAARTVFTHLNHDFKYEKMKTELPAGMEPAYDGLVIKGESAC
jgi:phosphoribosyl 1,2-cyclic phosphate phosphodiesterase